MIQISDKAKIVPLYSAVIRRFKALSHKYDVSSEMDIFYQQKFLDEFFSWQKECLNYADPSLELRIFEADKLPKIITSNYGYNKFVVFATTLGLQADQLINKSAQTGEVFKSYFIDSWYSESVEIINRHVEKLVNTHLDKCGRRFSPGFKDIDITVNYQLGKMANFTNITVNENNGILKPRKSTICLVGFNDIAVKNTKKGRWFLYEDIRNFFAK
ncbi:hypothetical protein [Natranaerobius thermophilus]|uniref:Uncharacterized protein n=1 Tax=Natranaerobius thermophilus (strain ATCC BAA-1301 / DSM 18059 / JW/NM-WN-LF) TaxID=457570 RepID=B2A779_NATTJ|nr:hypothetical protein [Natranaerobius thermophilus]ACB84273.1 hypothetical protein Nther_0680 [Natranaerobius thermophilus JW/NM-WN-LF]